MVSESEWTAFHMKDVDYDAVFMVIDNDSNPPRFVVVACQQIGSPGFNDALGQRHLVRITSVDDRADMVEAADDVIFDDLQSANHQKKSFTHILRVGRLLSL